MAQHIFELAVLSLEQGLLKAKYLRVSILVNILIADKNAYIASCGMYLILCLLSGARCSARDIHSRYKVVLHYGNSQLR